jgi:hypothetical protein
LLDLNDLEEVNKYSSPPSLPLVKLTSVEETKDGLSLPLLTAFSLFRLQLPFECINFFKKETRRPKTSFRVQLWLQSKPFYDVCSAISRVVVVLVTIVTPHVGTLLILRRLAYTTDNRFLIIY